METTLLELEPVTVESVADLISGRMIEAMTLGTGVVSLAEIGTNYYYYIVPVVQQPWVRRDGKLVQLSLNPVEAVQHALEYVTGEMDDRVRRERTHCGRTVSAEYKVKVAYYAKGA